ncbi:MAG: hypothetical protein M3347_13175 [Armatimonadota bacterium]|nr:hypothetical protein [Armatimonadota bacterium]
MAEKREYAAGRDYFGGSSLDQIKRAEEIIEQKFGSVDAIIDADPELRAMRDEIEAQQSTKVAPESDDESDDGLRPWTDEERDAMTENLSAEEVKRALGTRPPAMQALLGARPAKQPEEGEDG